MRKDNRSAEQKQKPGVLGIVMKIFVQNILFHSNQDDLKYGP